MTNSSPSPVRRFDFSRVFAILLRPRAAFVEVASEARATWLAPMLILSITALLVVLTAGYLKTRAAMMGEIPLPPDWQWWTPEMQENYMRAQQATQGPVFMYIIPLVGAWVSLWLGWLIFAGLLHLGSTLLGGRGTMQSALNIVAWASLPFAIRDVLRIAFMLSVGHTITSPGLSGFVSDGGFMSDLLARTDIFLIWNIILLAIGLAFSDGLSRGKSFAGVLIAILIVLLAQAGFGALVASLGGAAVQRPLF